MTRGTLAALALFAGSAAGIASTQPGLARTYHATKEGADVYAFPPPAQLHAATLGWDAAVVDVVWAALLVEYGNHFADKRDFTVVPLYADAILELEPDFAPLYRYVDTMLAYRPMQGTESDVRLARAYLERGTRERPNDSRVWMELGQFVAFIAPSFLTDEGEKQRWRTDGAQAIARATELGAEPDRVLSAAGILSRAGQERETIGFLKRMYAFTEHPSMRDVHEAIGRKLKALQADAFAGEADGAMRAIQERQDREAPHLPFDLYLLLGPHVDAARCSGPSSADDPDCARDWDSIVKPR